MMDTVPRLPLVALAGLLLATMVAAEEISGTVVDPTGQPVAGARVAAFNRPGRQVRPRIIGSAPIAPDARVAVGSAATTDLRGRFRLPLPAGELVSLEVSAQGLAPATFHDVRAGARVRLGLDRGVALRIELGAEAAGARLRLRSLRDRGRRTIDATLLADEAGVARFEQLPPNRFAYLEIIHPTLGNIPLHRIGTPPARPPTLTLRLPRGVTIQGEVVDAASKKPVAGALIGLDRALYFPKKTGEDGRFSFPGWSLGAGLYVRAPGYVPTRFAPDPKTTTKVTLTRGNRVTGRIVDHRGHPVADAVVAAKATRSQACHAITDAQGRFLLDAVQPASGNTLVVTARGHGRRLLDFDPPAQEPGTLDLGDISLTAPLALTGRVLHADGRPAARLPLRLSGTDNRRKQRAPKRQGALGLTLTDTIHTDELGRFTFPDLAPGSYQVLALPWGGKPVTKDLVLAADTAVTLRLLDPRTWSVRVVDDTGRPAWGVTVRARSKDGWTLVAESDLDGIARFFGDSEIVTVEQASCPERRFMSEGPLAVGTEPVTINMAACRPVRIRVLQPDNNPLAYASVRLHRGDKNLVPPLGLHYIVQADKNGIIETFLPKWRRADLELYAVPKQSWQGEPLQGRRTGVHAGPEVIELKTEPARGTGRLSVLVLDPDGNPFPGAQVYAALDGRLVKGANVLADPDGIATLQNLPRRPLTIWAKQTPRHKNTDGWMKAFSERVRAQGQQIRLQIERALVIRGIVRDPQGQPVAGAFVTAEDDSGFPVFKKTDKQGRFRFDLRPSRAKKLWIYAQSLNDKGERWFAELREVPRDGSEIELRLKPQG